MRNKRNILFPTLCILALLFASGCATTGKSIGAGALVGGIGGAGVGAIADPGENGKNRVRNVIIGTAIGSAVGAGTGFIIDRINKDDKQASFEEGKKAAEKASAERASAASDVQPRLVPAKTEAKWVPDQVRGNVYVPAHYEYLIIEPAHWER